MSDSMGAEIARSDDLYAQRFDIANVKEAAELLARSEGPWAYDSAWRLGRAHFFLGQQSDKRPAARTYHSIGVRHSKQAVRLAPERVEGNFWLGVNLALLAQCSNKVMGFWLALRAGRCLKRAIAIDPAYHGAGPLRVLARLEQSVPRVLGGGLSKARVNYERALALAPSNTVTRLYLAGLLLKSKDVTGAERELHALLDAPFDPVWAFEKQRDRRIAREILRKHGS